MSKTIVINGERLTVEDLWGVAVKEWRVELDPSCRERMEASRRVIEDLVARDQPVYGVTTGVGPLCNRLLPREQAQALQRNLVRALSAGVGDPLPGPAVRACMLARANSFMKGCSGVRWSTVQALADLLNAGVHPEIPEVGSVGASGDLAHLGHLALGLIGEGRAHYRGELLDCAEALRRAGLEPVVLGYKEGLALVNGTGFMTGVGALSAHQALHLAGLAELGTTFLVEVFRRTLLPFDPRIHRVKGYAGQELAARHIVALAAGSRLVRSGESMQAELAGQRAGSRGIVHSSEDIQDPYSIRCAPQVSGAVRDHLEFIVGILETELNSVNDNPLVFAEEGDVAHGGNFLGQHVAFAVDTLSLLLSQLATLCERQFARLIDDSFNFHLPPMLIHGDAGLKSAFMPVQLVATALAADIRTKAAPASLHSIPTNANNQDVVTMGGIAAMKNERVVEDLANLLAIHLIGLCQAADLTGASDDLGRGTQAAYRFVRERVPFVDDDRALTREIRALGAELRAGALPVADLIGDGP